MKVGLINWMSVREISPGASVSNDAQIEEYIKDNVGTTFRRCSTLFCQSERADIFFRYDKYFEHAAS